MMSSRNCSRGDVEICLVVKNTFYTLIPSSMPSRRSASCAAILLGRSTEVKLDAVSMMRVSRSPAIGCTDLVSYDPEDRSGEKKRCIALANLVPCPSNNLEHQDSSKWAEVGSDDCSTASISDSNCSGTSAHTSSASGSPRGRNVLVSSDPGVPWPATRRDRKLRHVVQARFCTMARQTQPIPSRGSKNHKIGLCRPCKLHFTPNGCTQGSKCNFCHFPHQQTSSMSRSQREREQSVLKLSLETLIVV